MLRERDLPPFEAAIAAGVRAIMPRHLRVPELTGDLPASLSRRAQTDLLRGELGFTGVIVSDGLEMRAVSERYGIPEAAVQAVIAGTDLLCLGRDQDQLSVLAVRAALVEAVRTGRLAGERLEEAAARVAELRAWTSAAKRPVGGECPRRSRRGSRGGRRRPGWRQRDRPGRGPARHHRLRSAAAARPPARRAAGAAVQPGRRAPCPGAFGSFVPAGSYREISTGTPADATPRVVSGLLAQAAGRIADRRRARRAPAPGRGPRRELMLAARPDAVVLEMGLPVWRPATGRYVASYGAARSNSRAAAEALGLAGR